MIDYFALALGHGLMAIALLRLVLRPDLDVDPLITRLKEDTAANRMAASTAGRNAARRARGAVPESDRDDTPRAEAAQRERDTPSAQVAQRERNNPRAQVAKR